MRLVFTFFFLSLAIALSAQSIRENTVSARLMEQVLQNPEGTHHFYIALKDKADMYALGQSLRARKASLAERSLEVITTLKAKADETQGPLLAFLEGEQGVEPGSIQPFWIANLIYVKARVSVIEALSWRDDVDFLDWNAPLAKTEHEETLSFSAAATPNGKEPGLSAINAPAMWAKGYTGYGRVAFVNDTGVDPRHPALAGHFRGFYTAPEISWYEYDSPNTDPYDCSNHGTHVTGTVLGLDRMNNDTIGVAFNAKWTGASTIGCPNGLGNLDNIGALQWAIDPDGNPETYEDVPDAINNSWYDPTIGSDCASVYVDVLNALDAVGVAVVFSAGNQGPDDETISPPHNINTDLVNSFTVGALNGSISSLPIANFSSRGPSKCGGEGSILIKPEVSAPGVGVRSAVPGGGYSNFNGTSMAAPHTTGAILLLKEAFPYLAGNELKLALYYSCTDLGEPGEDNVYGMGIINVDAAFDYLVGQGHIPVPPVYNTDALLITVEAPEYNCEETLTGRAFIENAGLVSISEMEILVEAGGASQQFTWTGLLEPGERTWVNLPVLSIPEGVYSLMTDILSVNGTADDRSLNNRFALPVKVLDRPVLTALADLGADMTVCDSSTTALRAQYDGPAAAAFRWYDAPSGGALLGEGPVFLAGPLEGDSTFYVEARYVERVGFSGKENGSSQLAGEPNREGLVFDAYAPFTIKSVKMYTTIPGGRFLQLLDADGDIVKTKIVSVNAVGEVRVNLNLTIPEGKDLQLVLDAGIPLMYNTSGPSFPYTVEDVLQIKRSNTPNGLQRWYYFYDWEIEYEELCGRAPVQVSVFDGDAPLAAFAASADTVLLQSGQAPVSFSDQSQSAVSWHWNFGDGVVSDEQNPSHSYASPGVYTVSLSVADAEGCASSAIGVVVVEDFVSSAFEPVVAGALRLYPNPARDYVELEWEGEAGQILVFDAMGRPVRILPAAGSQARLSLEGLPAGLYAVVVRGVNAFYTAKFQVIR